MKLKRYHITPDGPKLCTAKKESSCHYYKKYEHFVSTEADMPTAFAKITNEKNQNLLYAIEQKMNNPSGEDKISFRENESASFHDFKEKIASCSNKPSIIEYSKRLRFQGTEHFALFLLQRKNTLKTKPHPYLGVKWVLSFSNPESYEGAEIQKIEFDSDTRSGISSMFVKAREFVRTMGQSQFNNEDQLEKETDVLYSNIVKTVTNVENTVRPEQTKDIGLSYFHKDNNSNTITAEENYLDTALDANILKVSAKEYNSDYSLKINNIDKEKNGWVLHKTPDTNWNLAFYKNGSKESDENIKEDSSLRKKIQEYCNTSDEDASKQEKYILDFYKVSKETKKDINTNDSYEQLYGKVREEQNNTVLGKIFKMFS